MTASPENLSPPGARKAGGPRPSRGVGGRKALHALETAERSPSASLGPTSSSLGVQHWGLAARPRDPSVPQGPSVSFFELTYDHPPEPLFSTARRFSMTQISMSFSMIA
jgi:hypothetical protein